MPPVHYQPDGFPPEDRLDWRRLIPLIGPTATAVARYDSLLRTVPSAHATLAALRVQEAVSSSRIENIFTSVTEVLETDAGLEPANPYSHEDANEVLNYLAAERRAAEMLPEKPLSLRVIREAHGRLLAGDRGRGKSPGRFRRSPVWIGGPGSTLETATFVPAPAEQVPDRMSAWERHVNADSPDRLVQVAVQHAEFEAVHPFLDGNGRLGRMLIPLLMRQYGLIGAPVFSISRQIAPRRIFYYDALLGVSRDDDWTGWCLYLLDAIRAQAQEGAATIRTMLDLRAEVESHLARRTRARLVDTALDRLFANPVFRAGEFAAAGGIPSRTARRMLSRLRDKGVLEEAVPAKGRRSAVLRFPRLLEAVAG